jgi:hypothetical protein
MSALEEYRKQCNRIGKEYQPRDYNGGANDIKHYADAAIAEQQATIERLTFLYKAATGPQQRADLERQWAERGTK